MMFENTHLYWQVTLAQQAHRRSHITRPWTLPLPLLKVQRSIRRMCFWGVSCLRANWPQCSSSSL